MARMRNVIGLTVGLLASSALAFECEDTAVLVAKMAVEKRGADKTAAQRVIFQRGRRTVVWLQARYDDERPSTQWCVFEVLDKGCGERGLFDEDHSRAVAVRECATVPSDERLREMMSEIKW